MKILHAIGNTTMVRLRQLVPPNCANVFIKLEWENPTGSMKDRMAHAVISRAEEDGRLKPGDTVVEYTGGSTGASLALVCVAKGYPLKIVSSDAFSQEKLDHMAALGAELTLVKSEGGLTTKKLILDMIEAARKLSQEPYTYWTDQLNNHDSIKGYFSLGEEIWTQTKGEISTPSFTAWVQRLLYAESPLCLSDTSRVSRSSPSNPENLRCYWVVSRVLTRSKESGSATFLHSGSRLWWTRSCRLERTTPRTWPDASRGRKPSSRGRLLERTSSPRLKWQSDWVRMLKWSR